MSNPSRCYVCNKLSHGEMFCSQECKDEYDEVSERLYELNQDDEEPPYLDDYYAPYEFCINDFDPYD